MFSREYFGPVLAVHVYDDADWTATLDLVDRTAPYALTGSVVADDPYAVAEASQRLRFTAGNFYVNDKPTGAVVGQQPFGGARAERDERQGRLGAQPAALDVAAHDQDHLRGTPRGPPLPAHGGVVTGPLDMSQDPDRYDPDRDEGNPVFDITEHPRVVEPLDMSHDPDRYDPTREAAVPDLPRGLDPRLDPDRYDQTLPELLGAGAQVDERDGYQWVAGLLGVLAFLALVAFLFNSVLTPG